MTEDVKLEDQDLPLLFRAADTNSVKARKAYMKATAGRLLALLVAAVAGAFVVTNKDKSIDFAGVLAACAFLAAAAVETYLLRARPDRTWYEGRAVAESAKTLAWRYSVGGEPFLVGTDPESVDTLFIQQLHATYSDLSHADLTPSDGAGDQLTDPMRGLRAKSLPERRSAYESGRIDEQLDWYAMKAVSNDKLSKRWSYGMLAVEILGGVGAVFKAVGAADVDLLGFAAAIVAGAAAWVQTNQHQALAEAYGVAAQELAEVKALVQHQETEEGWARFVDDAEQAVSREHTRWKASRGIGLRTAREGP